MFFYDLAFVTQMENVIKRARLTSIFHALSPLWREISDAMTVIYEAEFLMSATGVSSAPRN